MVPCVIRIITWVDGGGTLRPVGDLCVVRHEVRIYDAAEHSRPASHHPLVVELHVDRPVLVDHDWRK